MLANGYSSRVGNLLDIISLLTVGPGLTTSNMSPVSLFGSVRFGPTPNGVGLYLGLERCSMPILETARVIYVFGLIFCLR
jgi:hypothetical protein